MEVGDIVIYEGQRFMIIAEYDSEFVYIDIGKGVAHLAHKDDLTPTE